MQIQRLLKNRIRIVYIQFRTYIQPSFQSTLWAGERGNPTSLSYENELESARNLVLWKELSKFNAEVIVEIGSSLGSKIVGLAKSNPKLSVVGLDINPKAIAKGTEIAKYENIENLRFREFDASKDNLEALGIDFKSGVVFTWATLIYVHPSDISHVLKSILNSQVLGFVFIEQHSSDLPGRLRKGKLINHGPNYVRDYNFLLQELGAPANYQIETIPIGPEVWSPGGGCQFMIVGRRIF